MSASQMTIYVQSRPIYYYSLTTDFASYDFISFYSSYIPTANEGLGLLHVLQFPFYCVL